LLASREWLQLWEAFLETIYMVSLSGAFSILLGAPLGIILVLTDKKQLLENAVVNKVVAVIVNSFRSIPFIILIVLLIPFTRLIVGISIGPTAATVPLIVGAAPFFARLVETALREVNRGVIEAALSMGASNWEIIRKVYLKEALPAIVSGITVTIVALISYSAMAGVVGGGGLGDLAIRYGYQRYNLPVMIVTTLVIIALVQIMQTIGDYAAKVLDKR